MPHRQKFPLLSGVMPQRWSLCLQTKQVMRDAIVSGRQCTTLLSALSCGCGGHKIWALFRQGIAQHRLELLLAAQILGRDCQTGLPRRQSHVAGVPGGCDGPGGGLGAS